MFKGRIAKGKDEEEVASLNPIEASNSLLLKVQIPSDGDEEDRKRAILSCLRMLRTCHPTSCRKG